MTSEQPRRPADPAPGPLTAADQAWPAEEPEEAGEGGDPACWARIVCQECGAVISEGHRTGCATGSSSV